MEFRIFYLIWISVFVTLARLACSLPEPGRWSFTVGQNTPQHFGVPKSLYKGSTITISVSCSPESSELVRIGWLVRQSACFQEYLERRLQESYHIYYQCPELGIDPAYTKVRYLKEKETDYTCKHFDLKVTDQHFVPKDTVDPDKCPLQDRFFPQRTNNLDDVSSSEDEGKKSPEGSVVDTSKSKAEPLPQPSASKGAVGPTKTMDRSKREVVALEVTNHTDILLPKSSDDHQITVDQDGVYLLIIYFEVPPSKNITAIVDIKMKNDGGYLSAVDWPLLPFYGVMCGLYVIFAIAWMTVSALQWRDLLRIQFWIGGVIFLGLVEKAVFLNEYQSINSTGQTGHAGMILAEVVSCLKRTLARLLVIIVSLGFGIVKPRLGPALHRIVGVGSLYFILCSVEGCLRVLKPKNDPSNQTIMAEIPLAVLDSAICWWIFSSLVQTTRTLRLRRNVVKLGLYRHFTNTLIFSVLASAVYMTWSLYNHRFPNCLTDWKELWVDEAYWHLLFSLILMVIMVLWRPTNNNQRYAFTPLLDALDDEEEDNLMEKENTALSDIYGTKARNSSGGLVVKGQQASGTASSNSRPKDHKEDDDLKWVEDNIPSSITDTALPSLLDSDEEIMTVRYERNKME